jgi:FlaA1/EpsC-like NDP-sugar epimerase
MCVDYFEDPKGLSRQKSDSEKNSVEDKYSVTITSLVVALYGFIGIYAFNTPMNLTCAVFLCVASLLLFLAIIISAFSFIKQQSGIANGFIIVLFLVALLIVTVLFGISLFQKAKNAELEKAQKTIGISTNDSQISFPYSQKGFVINGEIKDGQFEIMQKPLPLENDTK